MMNFHNNTALNKVLHTLQDNQNNSKQSKQIFQSVLAKHFQIIQTFLQKINALYNKQQQLQNNLLGISQKAQKLETDSKNIHYEFRTTHLMIDKRLNTIGADFNNMQEQLQNLQLNSPIDDYLSSSHFLEKSSRLKTRKRKSKRRDNPKNDSYKVVFYSRNQQGKMGQSLKQQEDKEGAAKNVALKLKTSCKTINRGDLKLVQFDGVSSHSSQKFESQKVEYLGVKKEENLPLEMYSQQQSDQEGIDETWVKQCINKQINKAIAKISDQLSSRIKQLQDSILRNRQQIEIQMLKKQQFSLMECQLTQKISEKTGQIRKNLQAEHTLVRQQVIALAKENHVTFQTFQSRLVQKIDSTFFQQSLTNLNAALSQHFTEIQRFYANKSQTKKALDFLENKLNRFILEENTIKSKKIVVSNQNACLRISKCQSLKKIEIISQKSIKDKVQKVQQGGQALCKSLDTSIWQIQPAENSSNILNYQKSNLNSLLLNISKLKSPSTSGFTVDYKQKELSKVGKSLSAPKKQNRLSLKITNAEPKVSIKQWREKVVKILRKEDIRKRKVTFR